MRRLLALPAVAAYVAQHAGEREQGQRDENPPEAALDARERPSRYLRSGEHAAAGAPCGEAAWIERGVIRDAQPGCVPKRRRLIALVFRLRRRGEFRRAGHERQDQEGDHDGCGEPSEHAPWSHAVAGAVTQEAVAKQAQEIAPKSSRPDLARGMDGIAFALAAREVRFVCQAGL